MNERTFHLMKTDTIKYLAVHKYLSIASLMLFSADACVMTSLNSTENVLEGAVERYLPWWSIEN